MIKFLGLDLKITKDTFIPRPETELLVKECLNTINNEYDYGYPVRVLDIGTGTGNIAISLTKSDRICKIVALDKSESALRVAIENAVRTGVFDRIEFLTSDLFSNLGCHCEERSDEAILFDIIVSNPPYVANWEISTLAGHVKDEPTIALDGGDDGLDFYKKIIKDAPKFLKYGGHIIMELGYNQVYKVKRMLKESGRFTDIVSFKDFANIDRVIKAKNG